MYGVFARVFGNVIADCFLAHAIIDHKFHKPHLLEFFRRIDLAAGDHPHGAGGVQFARQEAVGPHSGEQVEEDFWKAELGGAFRDDDVR